MNFLTMENELNNFKSILQLLIKRQDNVESKLQEVLEKIMTNELVHRKSHEQLTCCAKAFRQTKVVVEKLCEKMSDLDENMCENIGISKSDEW